MVVLAVLAMGSTMTPLFHAKTIRIEGARHLSDRQVRKLADVDAGTNVFSLDEGAVARRLERSPWILDAVVSTSLPSTVRIEVTERVPVAVAKTDEGSVALAADGSVLGPARAGGLPEIRALEAPAGETAPPVTGPILSAATSAAAEFGPTLRPLVEAIVVQPDATLTLELRDGVTVTYGGSSDLQAKAEALRAILDYADREGKSLISIDLRSPAAPTARFVGTPVVVSIPAGQTAGQRDGRTGERDGAGPAHDDGTSSPSESSSPSQ